MKSFRENLQIVIENREREQDKKQVADRLKTFPNYKFGKGQYAFYLVKLSRFVEKNKVRWKYQNFIRGDPYELGRRPLQPVKNHKSQSFSRGVLVIQTS